LDIHIITEKITIVYIYKYELNLLALT